MRTRQIEEVRQRLLAHRSEPDQRGSLWPFLGAGETVDQRCGNKFMLGAIIDYQIDASAAWENARRFAEDDLHDPLDLWGTIVRRWTEDEWNSDSAWRECRLHPRFPQAHHRVRAIGLDIHETYAGDARRIWQGQTPAEVVRRLERLGRNGVGEQLSRMIAGALIDTGQIQGTGDFKADTHVRTVLGRVFDGEKASVERALELGEELLPGNSWDLDGVLYWHGKDVCRKSSPKCTDCFLRQCCAFV